MSDFNDLCRAMAFVVIGTVLVIVLSPILVPVLIIRGVYLLWKDHK